MITNRTSGGVDRRSMQRQVIGGIEKKLGGMTSQVRERILSEALRHIGICGEHRIARVVAKTLHMEEGLVDAVLIAAWLEERSAAATLRTGMLSALELAQVSRRELRAQMGAIAA